MSDLILADTGVSDFRGTSSVVCCEYAHSHLIDSI